MSKLEIENLELGTGRMDSDVNSGLRPLPGLGTGDWGVSVDLLYNPGLKTQKGVGTRVERVELVS